MNRRVPRTRSAPVSGRWTSRSPDGRISFTLRRCKRGLYAERLHVKTAVGRLVQSIVFHDEAGFVRWCDADNARFAYPLVCSNLRRAGCELLLRAAASQDAPVDLQRP